MILINSCSKTKESEAENSGPTRLIFWIDSDFGCGPITVNINGKSAEITGYNAKEPYCGNAYSATYELSKGTYNFTASCSGKTWSGSVQVEEGKCNAYQLTSSGGSAGSGGTGGGGTGGTGTATVKLQIHNLLRVRIILFQHQARIGRSSSR